MNLEPDEEAGAPVDIYSRDPIYDVIGNAVDPVWPFGSEITRMSPAADDDQNKTRYRVVPSSPGATQILTVGADLIPYLRPTNAMSILLRLEKKVEALLEGLFDKQLEVKKHEAFRKVMFDTFKERTDLTMLRAHPDDFMSCRHLDTIALENHVTNALTHEMQAVQSRINYEIAEACVSLTIWLGIPLPLTVTFDIEETPGSTDVPPKVKSTAVTVADLPKTQDGREINDSMLTNDVRWQHAEAWVELFPEAVNEQYQRELYRKLIGPTFKQGGVNKSRGGIIQAT